MKDKAQNLIRKALSLALSLSLLAAAGGPLAADESHADDDTPLSITTLGITPILAGHNFNEYTGTKLEAAGGSGTGYTFSWSSLNTANNTPENLGINIAQDGQIYGIPLFYGQKGGIWFHVEDSAGNEADKRFALIVTGTRVSFTASGNTVHYDGKGHYPILTPTESAFIAKGYPQYQGTAEEDAAYEEAGEEPPTQYYRAVLSSTRLAVSGLNEAVVVAPYTYSIEFHGIIGYYPGSYSPRGFTVTEADVETSLSLVSSTGSNLERFTYDGNAHAFPSKAGENIVVEPEELAEALKINVSGDTFDYDIPLTYTGLSLSYGPTTEAPSAAGTYRVSANTARNTNYPEASASATLVIAKTEIDFTGTGDREIIYDGRSHKLNFTPNAAPAGFSSTSFMVTYDRDDTEEAEALSEVTDSGSYTVKIALTGTDENGIAWTELFDVGDISPAKVVVVPRSIDFTLTDYEKEVGHVSQKVSAPNVSPSVDGFTNYTVKYIDASEAEDPAEYSPEDEIPLGTYNVSISIPEEDKNNVLGSIYPEGVQFIVKLVDHSTVELPLGNSIAAMLLREAQEALDEGEEAILDDKERLLIDDDSIAEYLSSFKSTRSYAHEGGSPVKYSAEAFEGYEDLDLDPYAFIVTSETGLNALKEKEGARLNYREGDTNETLKSAVVSLRSDKALSVMGARKIHLMADDSQVSLADWGKTEEEREKLLDTTAIYTVTYTFDNENTGATTSKARTVLILGGKVGDIDGDTNINAGDIKALKRIAESLKDEEKKEALSLLERIKIYRRYDLTGDGSIGEGDYEALRKRFAQAPTLPYYPWT